MKKGRATVTGCLLALAALLRAQSPLALDPSFQTDLDEVHHTDGCFVADVARLNNGRLLVSGDLFYPGNTYPKKLRIFNADGSLLGSPADNIALGYGDGQIRSWGDMFYVRGSFMVSRFFGDGTLDSSFDILENAPQYVGLQGGDIYARPEGGLLMAGLNRLINADGSNSWYGLIGFTNTGAVDSSFTPRDSGGHGIYMLQPLANGQLLAAGPVTQYDGQAVSRVFRIWPDGSLDTTFHSPITTGTSWPRCAHELPDGKLLLGGTFTIGGDTLYLVRTFPDGTLDPSFNAHLRFRMDEFGPHPAWMASVNDIVPYGPNKFILAGAFFSADHERRGALAMIDTAGNLLDNELAYYGCDSVTGGVATPYSLGGLVGIKLLSDGYYYIYGRYTGFDDGTWYPHQRMMSRLYPANVGVQEHQQDLSIKLSPNPGSDVLHIETDAIGKIDVRVLDATGRAVLSASGTTGSLELSSVRLLSGVYLVEVNTAEGRRTVKWTKQ